MASNHAELVALESTLNWPCWSPRCCPRIVFERDVNARCIVITRATRNVALLECNFPFDVLKIDRSFVQDAWNHPGGVSLLRAIVAMAGSLGLEVIAEGVETQEQNELVSVLGCGFAQGYYFSRPLSPEDFEELVEDFGMLPKKSE